MRIEISKIPEVLENSNERMVVIGQPKEVGLTTVLIDFFSKKMFFEEDFSVLILVNDIRIKNKIAQMFEDFLESFYDFKTKFNYSNNTLKVYNNVVVIISYSNNDLAIVENVESNFKFAYSFVEKDEDDEVLNKYLTDYLPFQSNRIVIATYDTENSVYYMPEDENVLKINVYSELSKQNIQNLNRISAYTLNYEKIIKGLFND